MGIEALLRGWVSRTQPQAETDNDPGVVRLARYGEAYVVPLVRKQHALADEGSYFVTTVATGLANAITVQTDAAFAATHPLISIYNSDLASNLNNKRIHLDYVTLLNGGTATSNATSNTGTFLAVLTDNQDGVTGGTDLTNNIVNPNADTSKKASVAVIRMGALTAPAASANSRTVVGQRLVRLPVSATALTLANVDEFYFNFGGVEAPSIRANIGETGVVCANKVSTVISLPPITIGPGQSIWIYVFSVAGGAVTAGNYVPEIGWWER